MERQATVAVVGGGIIGMSTAWRLAQSGFTVTVYEKSAIGGEASWAGAGMLAPGGEFDEDSTLARLAMQSRDLYQAFIQELERDSGVRIDFKETGALDLAYSAEELEFLDSRAARQSSMGIPSKRVTPERMAIFWPRLNKEEITGGYFYPGDAAVDPRDVMAALKVACIRAGVQLKERCEIQTITLDDQKVVVNEKPHDGVVLAGGAWSGEIEVRGLPALPATDPVRGHLVGYRQPLQTCNTILRHGHSYLLQRATGLLIIGATEERVGFDRSIDQAAVRQLEKQAAQLMPHLGGTSPSEVWNGFRPGSDQLHLGAWHSKRVYLAYGHYRNGILLAPMTARLLSAEISANLQTR